MNALLIKVLAGAAVLAALIFGWNWFLDYERDIGYQKRVAEDAVQLNADLRAAREQTDRMFRIHDKALAEGAKREQDLKTRLAGVTASSGRLRDDITEYRRRLSEYSDATIRAYADTGLRLLGECQERYRDMAGIAQGHYNDVRTLEEAWPQ